MIAQVAIRDGGSTAPLSEVHTLLAAPESISIDLRVAYCGFSSILWEGNIKELTQRGKTSDKMSYSYLTELSRAGLLGATIRRHMEAHSISTIFAPRDS